MSPVHSSERFSANAKEALADTQLRGALHHVTGQFGERRSAAVGAVPEWEELRERARAIKDATLYRLDEHLLRFVENVEHLGGVVHWARDADEACRIVGQLARERGAKRLVKSKSMTTEEIGLNHALERAESADGIGAEPVETDLGEWIIQLAGELPSHIIAPAIHKTKDQVADLFVEKLGIEPTDEADPDELAAVARERLRRHFAEADLGISGVNFGVAETGTILILENEGNARLTTSLPKTHVAVMGIEKVIPRLEDLEVFLRLLPRSGTGQRLTSYQSLITGPKRHPDDEGPDELHVLLLDNGRSAMLREQVTRQSLACIRCGACLNVCPVYQQIGGHAYGSVYPGPIGAVVSPQLAPQDDTARRAAELPFASSLCGACRDVCPVKIDIPALLLDLRAKVQKRNPVAAPGERHALRLWAWAMGSATRYRWAARLARLAPWALRLGARAWTRERDLLPLAKRSFRDQWRAVLSREDSR